VGALRSDLSLEWGGNCKSIQDEPYFQLRPGWAIKLTERVILGELRNRHAFGKGAFA
jgi:peptidoglycan L-alanyl-D-glutamate endopeptidase CwlK